MSDPTHEALAAELVALGRAAPITPPAPDLAAAVLVRARRLPAPASAGVWERTVRRAADTVAGRRRAVAAAIVALAVGLLAAPPVRAAVADWFGFAGVRVDRGGDRGVSSAPAPPPATGGGLAEARRLVQFRPFVPTALGRPDAVEVSDDRRVLSMSWTGPDGPVRLDQFDGRLDYTLAKTAPDVEFTTVDGDFALWFPSPHEVVFLDDDGTRRAEMARLAGSTLIWERDGTTLRLEGELDLQRASEIAGSAAD